MKRSNLMSFAVVLVMTTALFSCKKNYDVPAEESLTKEALIQKMKSDPAIKQMLDVYAEEDNHFIKLLYSLEPEDRESFTKAILQAEAEGSAEKTIVLYKNMLRLQRPEIILEGTKIESRMTERKTAVNRAWAKKLQDAKFTEQELAKLSREIFETYTNREKHSFDMGEVLSLTDPDDKCWDEMKKDMRNCNVETAIAALLCTLSAPAVPAYALCIAGTTAKHLWCTAKASEKNEDCKKSLNGLQGAGLQ